MQSFAKKLCIIINLKKIVETSGEWILIINLNSMSLLINMILFFIT